MTKKITYPYKTQCPRCAENGNDNSGDNLHVYGEKEGEFGLGSIVGRWKIIESSPIKLNGRLHRKCECSCSNRTIRYVLECNLKNGKSYSCGCRNREALKIVNTKHGKSYSPTWKIWNSMLSRSHYYNSSSSFYYENLGIKVCDRWTESNGIGFSNFLEDMGERPDNMTLDRINPYGDYEPSNCRWATMSEQCSNRTRRKDCKLRTCVSQEKDGRYRVVLTVNHKKIYGGRFWNYDDAVSKIEELELKYLGRVRE